MYAARADAAYVVGVDMGESTVRAAVADLRGDVVGEALAAFDDPRTPAARRLGQVRATVADALGAAGVPPERVRAAVLGVPAPVTADGRAVAVDAYLPGLARVDLRTALGPLPARLIVENDADLAVLAERWRGAAVGCADAVLLLAGERLGAGICVGGRLVRGRSGGAGEMGFLHLVAGVGAPDGIGRLLRRATGLPAPDAFAAAARGEPTALAALDAVAERVGRVLAILATLLDPQVIVLGGAIAAAGRRPDGAAAPRLRGRAARTPAAGDPRARRLAAGRAGHGARGGARGARRPGAPADRPAIRRVPRWGDGDGRGVGDVKVVLFCGGLTEGDDLPKPMHPVGPRPLLWHVMRYYAHFGHSDFILCLGHGGHHIKDFFLHYDETAATDFVLRDGGVELLGGDVQDWTITFVHTGLDASIGERLRRVRHLVEGEEMFFVNYADLLTDAPLDAMVERFAAAPDKVGAMLAVPPQSAFHLVDVGEQGAITSVTTLQEMPVWENGGYFVLRPEIFEHLPEQSALVEDVFARLARDGRMLAYRHRGFWQPADTIKERTAMEAAYRSGHRPWMRWEQQPA